jgi:uncharacterized repeat protein (TIGR02543 family)
LRKLRLVALFALFVFVFALAATPTEANDENLPTLYLKGTPREMGLQHGRALREAIKENLNIFWEAVAGHSVSKEELLTQTAQIETFLSQDVIDELTAMAEGASVNYLELVAMNNFGKDFTEDACTTGIASGTGTLTGQAIGQKNRDWSGIQVLVIYDPRPGYHYKLAAVTSAGSVGISFGVNEVGLGTGNMLLYGPSSYPDGVSNIVINRIILEDCASVDEAITCVDATIRQEPSCFMVVDVNKAAYIEAVPSNAPSPGTVVKIVENGVAAHTNHYLYEPLGTRYWSSASQTSKDRYARMNTLMTANAGQITVQLMIGFSRDHTGTYTIDNSGTVSAGIMTPNKTYPTMLSAVWTAVCRPGYTIYAPLHNAIVQQPTLASTLLEPYMNGTACTVATSLTKYTGSDWDTLKARFVTVENDIIDNNKFNENLVADSLQKGASLQDCTKHLTIQDSWTARRVVSIEQFMYDSLTPPVTSLTVPPPEPAPARLTVGSSPPELSVPVLGEGWYDLNTDASLEAPASVPVSVGVHYGFGHWTVDGETVPWNPMTVYMDTNHTATVCYTLQYYFTVVSAHSTPSGEGWYNSGAAASSLVTSPESGGAGIQYVCTGYSGTGSCPNGSETFVTFTINEPSTVTWNWKTQYELTTTANPSGSGSVTPDGTIWQDANSSVYLSAFANAGYIFTGWSGDLTGSENPASVTMNGPKSITANFSPKCTLTIRSQHGTPDPPLGTWAYAVGAEVTASIASPVSGSPGVRYICTGWRARGSPDTLPPEGTVNSVTFTIIMNTTITWRWRTQYLLTTGISPESSGTIDISPTSADGYYDAKSTITLTAIENEGYDFSYWSGGLRGIANPQNLLLRGPRTVTANFIPE